MLLKSLGVSCRFKSAVARLARKSRYIEATIIAARVASGQTRDAHLPASRPKELA
jgi:hypothetical protein